MPVGSKAGRIWDVNESDGAADGGVQLKDDCAIYSLIFTLLSNVKKRFKTKKTLFPEEGDRWPLKCRGGIRGSRTQTLGTKLYVGKGISAADDGR